MKLKKKKLVENLAVVIPVYNEEKNIYQELKKWLYEFNSLKFKKFKFYVINDGSTDKTIKQVRKINSKKIHLFNFKNSGHGNACIKGYKLAIKNKFDWILQIDSDGQCDPKYLKKFLNSTKQCNCIFGLRVIRDDGLLRLIFSRILSFLILIRKGIYVKDMNVPYRLMHRRILMKCLPYIPEKVNLKNAYLTFLISKKFKIKYIKIKFLKRNYGVSKYNLLSMLNQVINLIKII